MMRIAMPVSFRFTCSGRLRWVPLLLGLLVSACADEPGRPTTSPYYPPTTVYRMERANRGTEAYSAWFGDSDGRVLYFGLSPFWELWWRTDGDARADLAEPGDLLIGRFDLDRQSFLPPLHVRGLTDDPHSSVWDVLVHSNGRIYYTTYFEGMGSVSSDGTDVKVFAHLGTGLNELYEGPRGNIYVTRYSNTPRRVELQNYGGVAELTPEGALVREIRFLRDDERFTAPKSVAVDPGSGEIWVNTDTFWVDGSVRHETIHLAPDGSEISREDAPPELHFVNFGPGGRGYFAESVDGVFRLRVTQGGRELAVVPLGPRGALDFIQDIHFTPRGDAILAYWSGRVTVVRREGSEFRPQEILLTPPDDCLPPQRESLLYSAVAHRGRVYATLHCGATVLSAPLPR